MWYPQSVLAGQVTMDRVVERLAQISTVSKSDVQAVMGDLASVLADYMSLGFSVEIEGLGWFYYTAVTEKQGVETADEVSANQITGVRVRFLPETTRSNGNRVTTRALSNVDIKWIEVDDNKQPVSGSDDDEPGEGETENPLA